MMLFLPCDYEETLKKLFVVLHDEFCDFEDETFRMIVVWY